MVMLTSILTKIKIRLGWTTQNNGVLMLFVLAAIRRMLGTKSVSVVKAKKLSTARANHAGRGLLGLDLEPKRGSALGKEEYLEGNVRAVRSSHSIRVSASICTSVSEASFVFLLPGLLSEISRDQRKSSIILEQTCLPSRCQRAFVTLNWSSFIWRNGRIGSFQHG